MKTMESMGHKNTKNPVNIKLTGFFRTQSRGRTGTDYSTGV